MQEGEIGRIAATLLIDRVAGLGGQRKCIRLEPELIVRESTAPVRK
jgi:DNA-binding LacI/PurR family transcriptional regulator